MYPPNSRYRAAATQVVTGSDGSQVAAVVPPLPTTPPVIGYHVRHDGERLDLLAARYLADPTGFWRLCDANNAMVPDALGARGVIGVPAAGA